jgi:signal transduction histidine kinase
VTNPHLLSQEYPYRIGRRLSLALALIIATVLLIGGVSISLTHWILQNQDAVAREYLHILGLDRIHNVFNDIILEFQQVQATGRFERMPGVQSMHADLVRRLEAFRDIHQGRQVSAWKPREEAAFGDLRQMAEELRRLTSPSLVAESRARPLAPQDLDRLSFIAHQVPKRVEELSDLHRHQVERLQQQSRRLLQSIVALYLIFTLTGGTLIIAASMVFQRRVSAPLQSLAGVALGIAEGRTGHRLAILSRDELGLVTHAFNVMADRLEQRDREIVDLHVGLQSRVLDRTQELEEALNRLTSAQEALVRSERAAVMGQIAAAVTHGIRTPLSALAINLQLLRRALVRKTLSPEQHSQLLSTADLEVSRINRTLEEFFRYARLPKPRLGTVDCNAVVRQIAAFLQAQAEQSRVEIGLHLKEDLPLIQADGDQLREALGNLSSNAIQAMPNGGRLGLETCMAGDNPAKTIMIRISDTGMGIAPETLPHIFEPFFSTKGKGLGLGLPIALRIAEEQGGTIRCQSTPGEGASFELILPVTPPANPTGPVNPRTVA